MRILFLCGSLELGKSGIGDYCRRISEQLVKLGHEPSIASLEDFCEDDNVVSNDNNLIFPILRLSVELSRKERLIKLKNYIEKFNPDWISLQYCPFSTQKIGLPFYQRKLKKLAPAVNWHIMFHELWVGMDRNASLKFSIWGALQKIVLKKVVHSISPKITHTQSHVYQAFLTKEGIKAEILPLFSNIPPVCTKDKNVIDQESISFAVFGTLHRDARFKEFVNWILHITKDKNVTFNFIGNNGPELENWISILKEKEFVYKIYGRQSPENISKIFSDATLGIVTTPYLFLEKSGTVFAMLEHNLPVICITKDWIPKINFDEGLMKLPVIKWNECMTLNEMLDYNIEFESGIESVVVKFLSAIKSE
ncbi:hypothetical protein D0T53_04770 [Dysgonomonas sp. 216]|uniref:glycosyltransferase family 4 protein n=1 Tax=Dysgonomonas sp. 216 TaxID=2302934 RepID=UPI0013D53209|nr:glycosyltransferase family 4 protein [Dysgonomonas sp. 216]NDW18232.1 hypothetical protein [Dysgonomonas sp. 216]